jgi:beta-phosphoglucomutase-like phosphatase (HAD superfamily)
MQAALTWFPDETFAAVVSRDDVEITKPDPSPYLLAAKLIGVDIRSCLVFEDSITGAQSGLRSGAQVIGIPHLIEMPDDPNLRVVKSLSDIDLPKLLDWYPFLDAEVGAK